MALGSLLPLGPAAAAARLDLADLSLEELSSLTVTSVAKSPELLSTAAAPIYVITRDDILRSGVTSLAEALRLAPNLLISQYSATNHIAASRGLGGAQELQNFSNKLLILIDGRSVYSPLYSGVYLDVQDLLLEDIDRIEVISGPGATLWGANAVNGVINVITRPAYLTDQPLIAAGYGTLERTLSGRYGAKASDDLSYRVYGKAFERRAMKLADGSSAEDDWAKGQAGFRVDWTGAADTLTTQGDLYRADEGQADLADQRVEGANLLSRWQHQQGSHDWQLQAYYDYSKRAQPPGGVAFSLHSVDLEFQNRLNFKRQRIVWGAGVRLHRYEITNSATLLFEPARHTLGLGNVFAQDTIALSAAVDLTLGLKLERDPFSGWTALPDARLSWKVSNQLVLWTSAARAIRAPTPFDHDVVERADAQNDFLVGNLDFKSEKVTAFDLGLRAQPLPNLSLVTVLFFNIYDDLRSIETDPDSGFLPLIWGNEMRGNTWGLATWAKWQVTTWWRLSPSLSLLQKDLEFASGSSQIGGLAQSGNDPRQQAQLSSSIELGSGLSFDASLRHVGALPEPKLKAYQELQASLQYRASRNLSLSVSGFNLLHPRHLEYPAPSGEYLRRGVIGQLRWTF